MCIHSSVKNKNSYRSNKGNFSYIFYPVFFKKSKSKRIHANISTLVISSDGIVGHLHFFHKFFYFLKKCGT